MSHAKLGGMPLTMSGRGFKPHPPHSWASAELRLRGGQVAGQAEPGSLLAAARRLDTPSFPSTAETWWLAVLAEMNSSAAISASVRRRRSGRAPHARAGSGRPGRGASRHAARPGSTGSRASAWCGGRAGRWRPHRGPDRCPGPAAALLPRQSEERQRRVVRAPEVVVRLGRAAPVPVEFHPVRGRDLAGRNRAVPVRRIQAAASPRSQGEAPSAARPARGASRAQRPGRPPASAPPLGSAASARSTADRRCRLPPPWPRPGTAKHRHAAAGQDPAERPLRDHPVDRRGDDPGQHDLGERDRPPHRPSRSSVLVRTPAGRSGRRRARVPHSGRPRRDSGAQTRRSGARNS